MQFDDQNVDVSGVNDQRGASRGGSGRGGSQQPVSGGQAGMSNATKAGCITMLTGGGLVTFLLLLLLFNMCSAPAASNVDTGGVETGNAQGVGNGDLATRCNTEGAIDRYNDCFLIKVYNETNEVWAKYFDDNNIQNFREPTLTFFSGGVSTGCGRASASWGPFYCPPDEAIYIDIDFLNELQRQEGANGDYAQAYILAHEYGHHLQTVLGIEQQVRRQTTRQNKNDLSVRTELQADCFAGVWGRLADDQGNVTVTPQEVREAQNAAAAVGDDKLQKEAGMRVNQDTWTHGSSEQRERWYTNGWNGGQLGSCDTFAANPL